MVSSGYIIDPITNKAKQNNMKPGLVAQVCNLSASELKAGESGVQGQPMLHSGFEASLDYMRPIPKKKRTELERWFSVKST